MSSDWVLLCPYLNDTAGHEAEYVERLARVAKRQGHAVRLILPRDSSVQLDAFPLHRRVPALKEEPVPHGLAKRLVRKAARLYEHHVRLGAYRDIFRGGRDDTTWLLHTAAFPEMALVLRAFNHVRRGRDIGRLKIIVRADHHDAPLRIRQFRDALAPAGPQVDLYADTIELAGMLTPLAPRPVGVVPIPGTPPTERPGFPRPVRFGYFGLRRLSKGFDKLPDILDVLPAAAGESLHFRAIVHDSHGVTSTEDHRATTEAILARGGVLATDRLTGVEYADALAATDIALMPYSVREYRFGSSGVFVDALHAGCAVVVPAGTWMAKEAGRRQLAGVFVADFADATSVAAATAAALDFRTRSPSETLNRAWLQENSPDGLFRALERYMPS